MFPVLATWRPPQCRTIYTVIFRINIFFLSFFKNIDVIFSFEKKIFFLFSFVLFLFFEKKISSHFIWQYLQVIFTKYTEHTITASNCQGTYARFPHSSFGEDSFGFTVWVLVGSCSASKQIHMYCWPRSSWKCASCRASIPSFMRQVRITEQLSKLFDKISDEACGTEKNQIKKFLLDFEDIFLMVY